MAYVAIPIIVCSGTKDDVYKQKVLATGIEAFLEKPYDSKELINVVKNAIGDA
jgi:FixJ family two-component response regulator